MNNDFIAISSEIKEIEAILASIPLDNVLERMSFETRLRAAKEELLKFPNNVLAPTPARLTFRGKPVFGSHGISADFAAKAAGAFSDAFAAVAAGLNESLGYMGPIPERDKNQLMITGTAVGSFGFQFELPAPAQDAMPSESKAELALEKIQSLFRLSTDGSDDEVAELVQEIHPRAAKKVYEFLNGLAQQDAWCGFEFKDQFFRYNNIEQLKRSSERLKEENIIQKMETFNGEFQGVLPAGKTFEFRLDDKKTILRGKVDVLIDDPDILNREWLHKHSAVNFNVIQVGKGRPRYTLLSLSDVTTFSAL